MRKKNSPQKCCGDEKNKKYVNQHVQPYLCTQFDDYNLKNKLRNAKIDQLIKQSNMHIFDEAELP